MNSHFFNSALLELSTAVSMITRGDQGAKVHYDGLASCLVSYLMVAQWLLTIFQ